MRGDAIVQFDWSVGQILETLDKLGLSENTLIILSSDNGPVVDDGYQDRAEELLNGHSPAGPLRGNKYSAFEGGTRIPAIVRWPKKITQPQVSDVLVSQIDWLASLASLVDARVPKGAAPDSFDRLGNWLGTDSTDRPFIYESMHAHAYIYIIEITIGRFYFVLLDRKLRHCPLCQRRTTVSQWTKHAVGSLRRTLDRSEVHNSLIV